MALDTTGRFFYDLPPRKEEPDHIEKTDVKPAEADEQRSFIKDYRQKKALVDGAALDTKDSILDKYGDVIDEDQKGRIEQEVCPEKYEIYNRRYFVETKLEGLKPEERAHILGFHEIESHEIALKDNESSRELRHVTTHETMHSLSYQDLKFEQGNGQWDGVENIDSAYRKARTGIREVIYDNRETLPDGQEKAVSDVNGRLNEGLTEMYTLKEIRDRGDEPGIAAYTQEVGWAMKLEECAGEDVVSRAYFGGDLEGLRSRIDELGGAEGTWEGLAGRIDWHAYLRNMEVSCWQQGDYDAARTFTLQREVCEDGINETLRRLNRRSKELAQSPSSGEVKR